MNNKNDFDYDEYLARIKSINNNSDDFSISNPKQTHQGVQQSQTPTRTQKKEFEQIPTQSQRTSQQQKQPQQKQAQRRTPQQPPRKSEPKQKETINLKIIAIVVVAAIICIFILVAFMSSSSDEQTSTSAAVSEETQTIEEISETTTETTTELTTEPTPTYSYETLLVNFENPIPDDYYVELVDYQDLDGDWWTVAAELVAPLDTLVAAAQNDGVYLAINSAYRSYESQNKLFVTSVEEYEDEGYSYDEAYELTGGYVAEPGTSEHQTGLSVDFGYTGDTTWTECYAWLEENSYKYGFIVRYPSGKSDITNITYETWHYRYVGVEIATEMYELDMCLEEYYVYKGW